MIIIAPIKWAAEGNAAIKPNGEIQVRITSGDDTLYLEGDTADVRRALQQALSAVDDPTPAYNPDLNI